jgi:hypothetical protein
VGAVKGDAEAQGFSTPRGFTSSVVLTLADGSNTLPIKVDTLTEVEPDDGEVTLLAGDDGSGAALVVVEQMRARRQEESQPEPEAESGVESENDAGDRRAGAPNGIEESGFQAISATSEPRPEPEPEPELELETQRELAELDARRMEMEFDQESSEGE